MDKPLAKEAGRLVVSIVVPVFNEEASIKPFLEAVAPQLEEVRAVLGSESETELVFVDDGSVDLTAERVRAAKAGATRIRLIKLSRNFGKDAALAAGLAHARGDAVIPMDVDLQDPPKLLPRMVESWLGGAKIVNAVRTDRHSDSWPRRNLAKAFYGIFDRLSSYPIHADVGDFRLLDRELVAILNQVPERVRFMKGLFAWLGYAPVEIEYRREARAAGRSKWQTWSLWNFALDGLTGTTTLPLRIWSYIGGALAVLALVYAGFIVGRTIIFGVDTPGYASLLAVILILGATTLIAIGIVGEYVGRIAIEVRQRPLYIIEGVYEGQNVFEDGAATEESRD